MLRSIGSSELLIILLAGLAPLLAFWKIFSKAGYPGVMGLTMLVPLLNVVMVLFLAFSEWPVLKEVEALRHKSPPAL